MGAITTTSHEELEDLRASPNSPGLVIGAFSDASQRLELGHRWGCEMADEKVEVSIDGLSRLQTAAREFARAEIDRLVLATIRALRSRSAEGVFGDVHARHLWDEYCWAFQEGPFDDPTIFGDTNFGSLSGAFDGLLQAYILDEVEKLPKNAQVFLSALAFEETPTATKRPVLVAYGSMEL